jgi:hypothetical protein
MESPPEYSSVTDVGSGHSHVTSEDRDPVHGDGGRHAEQVDA